MKKLVIIGAGGHGKVVADIAKLNGYDEIVFLDDATTSGFCSKYPIVGNSDCIKNLDADFFVASGNADVRIKISEKIILHNKNLATLVHPNATIGENVTIGEGTLIVAGAVVNPSTVIGKGCIINTCASVDHDNTIGDYVHIAVGAHVCGTVSIGNNTWIGAGATVSNNINICSDCFVGAGAVVVKDIADSGVYIGVPAKKM